MAPPDCGVDILDTKACEAFQCKASEGGAAATLQPQAGVSSLTTAVEHRSQLTWQKYILAINARYTSVGLEKLRGAAEELGLARNDLEILGPEYWDECCSKHYMLIKHMLDYRVTLEEKEVVDAFRRAKYYEQYVTEYEQKLRAGNYRITVTNNRTPVELDIPFSPQLSVENCVDVAMQLLRLSLDWTSFKDIDASAGPNISLTVDRTALPFKKTLEEVGIGPGGNVELWIKIVWRDGQRQATPAADVLARSSYLMFDDLLVPRLHVKDRGAEAVRREEQILQGLIWDGVARLQSPSFAEMPIRPEAGA